jgi:hypothetical protein
MLDGLLFGSSHGGGHKTVRKLKQRDAQHVEEGHRDF